MPANEIRQRFLAFFEKNDHTVAPSSSLVPENDPSVLFTTAGMQQFKPYYIGKANAQERFGSLNTASVQKCVRTSDIDEVGDERHLTFFEMLGNFSFGGYFKEEAIRLAHEFVTKEMGLVIEYVTVFGGEEGVPEDVKSETIWKALDPSIVVKKCGRTDNFWGPTGEEGPCGPTTEIYVDGIEIWNVVFNQYYQEKDKTLRPLETSGIDTGMGLERLALVSQFPKQAGTTTVFETDLFLPLMMFIKEHSATYDERAARIVADHIRTASFMIGDGVIPSNTERGYILRRVIRRAVRYADTLGMEEEKLRTLLSLVADAYAQTYPELDDASVASVFVTEEEKFRKTLERGMREFEKIPVGYITGAQASTLYQSYGFPFELIEELAREKGSTVLREEFDAEMKKHQETSRVGAEQKFKGGLSGHSDIEVRYHTATHLLNAALKKVLGEHVKQRGSNITTERLRFDFSHPEKLTDEQKKAVEAQINEWIQKEIPVVRREMPREEAEKLGAEMEFGAKYPDTVSVYTIETPDAVVSREFCGGPHVENTRDIGHVTIAKEESVAAGVRRIKATLA